VAKKTSLQSVDFARIAVDVASDKLASDVAMFDLREVSDFADYFVVLTAQSSRQINSLSQDIEEALEASGAALHHREGTPPSGWVLLDFSEVIVHLFGPSEREFYDIDRAWDQAIETVRIQ